MPLSEPCTMRWQCSPFHSGSPLWPVAQELASDPAGASLASVERRLGRSGVDLGQAVPLVAGLLGLPVDERHPSLQLGGEAQRHRLLATLREHLLGLATRRPLLVILEDAHWVDPTTLELTRSVLERIGSLPMLLVVSSRPEGMPALPASPHLTRLDARPPRAGQPSRPWWHASCPGEAAAGSPRHHHPPHRRRAPFVEELTKALAEQAMAPGGGASERDVPASLHDTLMARLDRLLEFEGGGADRRLHRPRGRSSAARRRARPVGSRAGARARAPVRGGAAVPPRHAADMRSTASSTRWCATRPTRACSGAGGATIHERLLGALEAGVLPASDHVGRDGGAPCRGRRAVGQGAPLLRHGGQGGDRPGGLRRGHRAAGQGHRAGGRHAGDTTAEVAMIDLRRARCWAFLATGDTPRLLGELRDAESRAGALRPRPAQLPAAGAASARREHLRRACPPCPRLWPRCRPYRRLAAAMPARPAAARFVQGQSHLIAGDYSAAVAELSVDADAYRSGLRMAAVRQQRHAGRRWPLHPRRLPGSWAAGTRRRLGQARRGP